MSLPESESVPSRRPKARRAKKSSWPKRIAVLALVLIVLVVGAGIGDYYYLGSLVHHQKIKHLQTVTSASSENILLIGSTDRCALKVQNIAYGLCSQGVTGVNSDIDMIVHLNPATGTVSLLSIPRDLFVPNARNDGANKIDAALYNGPSQLVAAIEEDFGIPINHYVELNFDTFAAVVNALGGVRMYFPTPIFDAESGLNIARPGCYRLDGYHALQVVRARHLQIQPTATNTDHATWPQEGLSDLARIRRTHEFLRVIAAQVAKQGLSNPITDQRIATSVLPDLTVDSGFSESAMVHLAKDFASVSIGNVPQETYPIVSVETSGYAYEGYNYGDIEFPVQPTGTSTISQLFQVKAGQSSFSGKALPAAHSFALNVENGSGLAGQSAAVATALTHDGFKVTSVGDRTPTGPVTETVIWYGGAAPPANGNWVSPGLEAALKVMTLLQGPVIMGYNPSMVTPGNLVTVQTGTGLTVTTPRAAVTTTTTEKATSPATTTTSPGVTTTTVPDPSGIKGSNYFSAPNPTNPALAYYDPRACNAAGTGPAK